MYYKQEIGKFGEEKVVEYLINHHYTIIEKNFRCYFGEIDIIARDNKKNEIVFFEVKTRNGNRYGNPADAVNRTKKKHIYKTAECYIHKNNIKNEFIRIDVIEVYLNKNGSYSINHIRQIF